MDELGCSKTAGKWDCSKAKKVYAFCNGPVCPQSPTAINAMIRDGFPADKIYYYRGGMLDWDALGFPIVKDESDTLLQGMARRLRPPFFHCCTLRCLRRQQAGNWRACISISLVAKIGLGSR